MCGIAGIFKRRVSISEKEKSEIDEMLSRIRHRGPDDTGVCGIYDQGFENQNRAVEIRDNVRGILGFNRLSIQDLSPAGHQPMISDDRNAVITFNGEIYNVDELKETLRKDGCDMSFRGHSDTEVILKCYCMYGIDRTLRMLNGMFAILIADFALKTMYIARDRIGIIPCHIMIDEKRIIWASEIKAFLALSDFSREISNEALSDSFRFCYPNTSMYKNVENVEPGTYYSYQWENDTVGIVRYYSLSEYRQQKHTINVHECEEILKDCLRRQLISDAPLGVQLSGGIDSTLLAKYASDIYKGNGVGLCGFSLVNNSHEQFSEEKWIDYAAKRLHVDVHKYDFNEEAFAANYEKALYAFERFVSVPSPVGIYKFSTEARKHVTVLISGEGADELAGGYGDFSTAKFWGMCEKIIGRSVISKYGRNYPQTINTDFIMNYDSMLSEELSRRIFPSCNTDKAIQSRRDYISSLSGSYFEKLRLLYFREELVSLLERQNKVCMSNSVENRVPFLDNRFVELLFSINERQLLRPTFVKALRSKGKSGFYMGKYILKQISAEIYGKEFAFRKKQTLRIPVSAYIQNPRFRNYLGEYIIPGMKKRGIINMQEFEKSLSAPNDITSSVMAWKAINMEAWMQLFYDGRGVVEV